MDQVNERSTAYVTCTFKDKSGASQQPTAITYTVHDVYSGAALVEASSVTPEATVEITLPPSANAILNTQGTNDRRRLTVIATYGAGESDAVRAEHIYEVVNLGVVT